MPSDHPRFISRASAIPTTHFRVSAIPTTFRKGQPEGHVDKRSLKGIRAKRDRKEDMESIIDYLKKGLGHEVLPQNIRSIIRNNEDFRV